MENQKIIIAFYVPVGGKSRQKAAEELESVYHMLEKDKDETEKYIIIPTNETNPKVEVLNPVRLDESVYLDIERRAHRIELDFQKFLNTALKD